MKRVAIIDVDHFLNSNLYKKLTKVDFNVWEDDEIIAYKNAELKGKVSIQKAKLILDTLYMTKEQYLEVHKVPLDTSLQSKYIEFCNE